MVPAEENKTTEELFRLYSETKLPETREEIIERHLGMAEALSHRYVGRGVDYEDLLQVASYALVLAVDRFDPEKGVQFVGFAAPTIIGEIKKYFRETAWSLKVPRRLKEISMRIIEDKEKLQATLLRAPTVRELAEYMDISEEEVIEALESGRAYTTYSLDQEVDDAIEGDSHPFEKFLGDEDEGFGRFEISGVLERVMEDLSPTERDIVRRRFVQEASQREVAEALGLSQMAVSRIERAMKKKFRAEYNL